ncbi:MAG: hypothetical protein AAGH79_14955 [Bacteroidota bacterium]
MKHITNLLATLLAAVFLFSGCTQSELGLLDLTLVQGETSQNYFANYAETKKGDELVESGWTSSRTEGGDLNSITLFSNLQVCNLAETDCFTLEIAFSTTEDYMLAMEEESLGDKTDAMTQFFLPGLRLGTYNNGESSLRVQVSQLDDIWVNDAFGDATSNLEISRTNIVDHPSLDELVVEVAAVIDMNLTNVTKPGEEIRIFGDVLYYHRIPFQ